MTVHITYRLSCNFCKLMSPEFSSMDYGPRGWSGDGTLHFCCKEHEQSWNTKQIRPLNLIDMSGIVQGEAERSYQNLETYIEAYLKVSPRNIDELNLVEQRSYEGGTITVKWWLEPKGR